MFAKMIKMITRTRPERGVAIIPAHHRIPGVPNLPSAISTNSLGTESGSGDGGTIVVEARMVVLTDGAEISSETVGSGDGETVIVRAQDAVLLSGASLDGFIPSGIVASTLSHDDNSGNAGTIEIEADTVHLSGGAHIRTNTRGSGRGGAVSVMAREAVILEGRASEDSPTNISAEAEGSGDAGTVLVAGQMVTLSAGARISSATFGSGQGGTVIVNATDTVAIDGPESGLSTDTAGDRAGGNITINTQHLRLTDGATISAQSIAAVDAGTIAITAGGSVEGHRFAVPHKDKGRAVP
ncbi:hypothetical protein C2W62_39290 [Candidatus Entotheonella serta]|nr:hypothetical protein C2W62_39290 [Candidatus Entotheonella serta]